MGYLTELRSNWRPVAAATFGLGTGFSLTMYTTSILAPHMMGEFGWTKAQFALVGMLAAVTAFALPLAGRLADSIGVRRTVLIGIVGLPIILLAFSAMTGNIGQYMALYMIQSIVCVTTTSTVYSRIAVQFVSRARGLALAIVASGPAVTGAIGGPILISFVEGYGWRSSFHALAIFSVVAGIITISLLPAERREKPNPAEPGMQRAKGDLAAIFRSRTFWILVAAMLLCNLPQTIATTQLMIVLADNGVSGSAASVMLSTFAIGTLAGRFISGLALDRFQPYVVAFVGMALPSLGLALLASDLDAPFILTAAVGLIGFSFGAEGDVVGYLVARQFGLRVYSTVMGLLTFSISVSASSGAALLSLTLNRTGGFNAFLLISGAAVLVGSLLFLLLSKGEPGKPAGLALSST